MILFMCTYYKRNANTRSDNSYQHFADQIYTISLQIFRSFLIDIVPFQEDDSPFVNDIVAVWIYPYKRWIQAFGICIDK